MSHISSGPSRSSDGNVQNLHQWRLYKKRVSQKRGGELKRYYACVQAKRLGCQASMCVISRGTEENERIPKGEHNHPPPEKCVSKENINAGLDVIRLYGDLLLRELGFLPFNVILASNMQLELLKTYGDTLFIVGPIQTCVGNLALTTLLVSVNQIPIPACWILSDTPTDTNYARLLRSITKETGGKLKPEFIMGDLEEAFEQSITTTWPEAQLASPAFAFQTQMLADYSTRVEAFASGLTSKTLDTLVDDLWQDEELSERLLKMSYGQGCEQSQ